MYIIKIINKHQHIFKRNKIIKSRNSVKKKHVDHKFMLGCLGLNLLNTIALKMSDKLKLPNTY